MHFVINLYEIINISAACSSATQDDISWWLTLRWLEFTSLFLCVFIGQYTCKDGKNRSCLVYVGFNHKIYVYYKVELERMESTNLLKVLEEKPEFKSHLKELGVGKYIENVIQVRPENPGFGVVIGQEANRDCLWSLFLLLDSDSDLNANEWRGKQLFMWQTFAANKLLLTGEFNEPYAETVCTSRFFEAPRCRIYLDSALFFPFCILCNILFWFSILYPLGKKYYYPNIYIYTLYITVYNCI